MKNNVTAPDRVIRVILAIVMAVLYATGVVTGTTATILLIAGIIFLLTGIAGYCPIYAAFGIGKKQAKS